MSERINTADIAPTLTSSSSKARGGSEGPKQLTQWGVRRLTPVECERLQAFPDGWTEPAGSDSSRYRALGNAVTVAVPQWAFGRMLDADR